MKGIYSKKTIHPNKANGFFYALFFGVLSGMGFSKHKNYY